MFVVDALNQYDNLVNFLFSYIVPEFCMATVALNYIYL